MDELFNAPKDAVLEYCVCGTLELAYLRMKLGQAKLVSCCVDSNQSLMLSSCEDLCCEAKMSLATLQPQVCFYSKNTHIATQESCMCFA